MRYILIIAAGIVLYQSSEWGRQFFYVCLLFVTVPLVYRMVERICRMVEHVRQRLRQTWHRVFPPRPAPLLRQWVPQTAVQRLQDRATDALVLRWSLVILGAMTGTVWLATTL